MGKKITNWKFWVFLLTFNLTLNFGLNAQNIVTTTQCTSTANCDGTATVNPNMIGAPNWNWQQDSVNILQAGGTTISNLCPGNYFLTFVDSLSNTVYVNFTIQGPNANPCANTTLSGAVSSAPCTDTVNCNGNVVLNVGGGVLPYQFQSNGIVYTNPVIQNLCPGVYIFTVVDSLGCSITLTGVVQGDTTVNPNPCANTTLSGTITTMASTNSTLCDGTAILNIAGGASPYVFSTTNGIVNSSNLFTDLCPGTYVFMVQDDLGCSIILTGVIMGDSTIMTNPCANNMNMMFAQITTTNTSAQGVCDGSISVTAVGGSGMYMYNWNNGATTATLDNVCSDVYTVMVSDTNGCVVSATGYVGTTFDSTFVMNLNGYVIPTGVSADGNCDGTASVIVYGGTAPYTFLYTDGGTNSTTANLCAGFQSVTVTDDAGATMALDFLVPSPINVTSTGNYNDSTLVDSVYNTAIPDCIINYSIIDSAFVSNYTILPNDSLFITWSVVYGDSVVTITDYYGLGLGTAAGVYMVVLQIYCPGKAVGNYLTAYDQVYYNAAFAGINEQENNEFMVYPNPFNDHIIISLNDSQNTEVIITDMTGKEVFNTTFNSEIINVDLSALSAGQYIVTVNNGTSITNRKIVK